MTSFKFFAAIFAVVISATSYSNESVYVTDSQSNVVRSGSDLCWRTGYWTPALASVDPNGCVCDKDNLPADVCAPKVTIAVAEIKPVIKQVTIATDTLFDFDKATLRPEGKLTLDTLIESMSSIQLEVILIVGYTDRIGTEQYNVHLSQRRALAVQEYITSYGIPTNRTIAAGLGKADPRTDGCPTKRGAALISCLQPDRRVVIQVIGTQ